MDHFAGKFALRAGSRSDFTTTTDLAGRASAGYSSSGQADFPIGNQPPLAGASVPGNPAVTADRHSQRGEAVRGSEVFFGDASGAGNW